MYCIITLLAFRQEIQEMAIFGTNKNNGTFTIFILVTNKCKQNVEAIYMIFSKRFMPKGHFDFINVLNILLSLFLIIVYTFFL